MSESIVTRARELAANIRAHAEETERTRRLPVSIVSDLAAAGCFRMLVPQSIGGLEVSPTTMIRTIEEVAQADGSAGWCVMVGATSGLMSAFLEENAAREIYGDALTVTSCVFAPMGMAEQVEGGYRVTGRWPFASGSQHCRFRMGGALVSNGDGPVLSETGRPRIVHLVFDANQTEILDTWSVSGLSGTGSHDNERPLHLHELRPHGVTVVSLWPGIVKTERMIAMKDAMPFDLSRGESPQLSGRAVSAIAADPNCIARSGQILVVADLAREYGFTDLDGTQPESLGVSRPKLANT